MRPIDADNVLKALGIFNDREHGDPHFLNGIETAREIVEQAPTVDAAPVRHGRWISECEPHYECSVCHHWFHLYDRINYCPNCGAKMDGDGDA